MIGEAALRHAARGWAVFPVEPEGKRPLAELAPHGFKNATTDPDTIRRWWEARPDANVGIATGAASGLIVVDIDPRNGGEVTWQAVREERDFPRTRCVETGGGGFHFCYAASANAGRLPKSLGEGIDLKGDGGYVVAPPSLHTSGRRYRVREDVPLARAPAHLFRVEPEAAARPVYVPPLPFDKHAMTQRERYAAAALRRMADEIARMGPNSGRNAALNRAWFRCGQFAGALDKGEARDVLLRSALAAGLDEREALKVLR